MSGAALDVSVVIPNWNGKALLGECLDALLAMERTASEIIVVDNGSTDGSAEFVKENYPDVRVLRNSDNRGFSVAVNEGIQAAGCAMIALLNNDAVVEKDWLEKLVEALERRTEFGFAASKVLMYGDREKIDSAGDQYAGWGMVFARGHGEKDDGKYDSVEEVFGACACAALYRKELFNDAGLFEESFFAYYEDVDWCLRARLRGHRCLFVPDARVYHHYSATSSGQKSKLGREEVYLHLTGVWVKNMPLGLMLRYLPTAVIFHGALFAFYLLAKARKQRRLPAVPFFRLMGSMLRQRGGIQRERRVGNAELDRMFVKRSIFEFVHSEAGG